MLNVPPKVVEQIKAAMCRPEGSVTFEYESPTAFKIGSPEGVLLEIFAGGHLFRLERSAARVLSFIHASPGTGTRIASIDLSELPEFERAFLAFTWTPEEICFYCGPRQEGVNLLSAKGTKSPRQFRIGEDGSVFQIGGEGVDVMGTRAYRGAEPILRPTAIEAWDTTVKAVDVLWTGKSDAGFLYEVVLSNLTLILLVTGLEAYAETRFMELETEGIRPDSAALFEVFSSKPQRVAGVFREMEMEAAETGKSLLRQMVDRGSINFQNYDHLKRAYNRAYGIKLGEIGVSSAALEDLQKLLEYRHRVVHVSPMLGMLEVSSEGPVFANKALAERARQRFDEVIRKLHAASLALRQHDSPTRSASRLLPPQSSTK